MRRNSLLVGVSRTDRRTHGQEDGQKDDYVTPTRTQTELFLPTYSQTGLGHEGLRTGRGQVREKKEGIFDILMRVGSELVT